MNREDEFRDAHRRLADGLDLPPELVDILASYPASLGAREQRGGPR